MNIDIACAGKLKESYFKDAVAEYVKRLSRYCSLKICEVADGPDMEAEAARLLKVIKEGSYIIVLDVKGTEVSSEELSERIEGLTVRGISHITFCIGGSDGLSEEIKKRADLTLSFSRLTFTHQMMRVILLEQIYRAFKIINHEPYHK